ncbi:MAG: hypothetical protein R2875_09320 [Desulfobacterales bacterium]
MPLGNGQYDYEVRLMYGRSSGPLIPGYMNLEAGIAGGPKTPSGRIPVPGGNRFGIRQKLYGRAKLDALVSMDNADNQTDAFGNPTSTLEYDLAKLDLTRAII